MRQIILSLVLTFALVFTGTAQNVDNIPLHFLSKSSNTALVRNGLTAGWDLRTGNLLLFSEALDNAAWTKTRTTTPAANQIIETATTGAHQISQAITFAAGAYSYSVDVKPSGRDWVKVFAFDGTAFPVAWVNTATCATTTVTGATATATAVDDGYCRVVLNFTASAGSGFVYMQLLLNGSTDSYAGDITKGVLVRRAQLNSGTTPLPYIATGDLQSVPNLVPGGAALQRGSAAGVDTNDPSIDPLFWWFDLTDDFVTGVPALASQYTILALHGWPNTRLHAYDSVGNGWQDGAPNSLVQVFQPQSAASGAAGTKRYAALSRYFQYNRVLNPRDHRQMGQWLKPFLYQKTANVIQYGHYGNNQPTIRMDWTGGGAATVDWGDGSATQNLTSGVNLQKTAAYSGGFHIVRVTVPSEAVVTQFYNNSAQMTGNLPDISGLTNLAQWYSYGNQHTGPLPDISGLTNLTVWSSHTNQHTGPLPDISGLTNLAVWSSRTNQHTGPLPDISGLTNLAQWYSYGNQHTGPLPNFSALNNLTIVEIHSNQHAGFSGTIGSRKLTRFWAYNNLLSSANVNAILAALVVAQAGGNPVCDVNLGGTGNGAPTGQGLTDKATLQAAGWTVATN
jgi:hypothetical protein